MSTLQTRTEDTPFSLCQVPSMGTPSLRTTTRTTVQTAVPSPAVPFPAVGEPCAMMNSGAHSPIHRILETCDFGVKPFYCSSPGPCDGECDVIGIGAPCTAWFVSAAIQTRIDDPSHNSTPHPMTIPVVSSHLCYALDHGQAQLDCEALRRTTPDLMDP